ncbi:head-tail connector protein [Shewanella sp. KCT]|uniref:head-tail connector protein n=1 Tax=Shewanella sp. KCT TaxID=2569535 RepID=UPI0011834CCE|nr:head-tail connector protein [Shewanella sp. KCT]TVP11800.1 hypothetical protein AYI87_15330 [Shewanella sp. KCT]
MSLLSLEQAREQVNLLQDETEFDTYLQQLSAAAEAYIARRLRDDAGNAATFVADQATLDAMPEPPANPLLVSESADLVLAAALLVGHWFDNRESVSKEDLKQVPQAFEALIFDYRSHAIG